MTHIKIIFKQPSENKIFNRIAILNLSPSYDFSRFYLYGLLLICLYLNSTWSVTIVRI